MSKKFVIENYIDFGEHTKPALIVLGEDDMQVSDGYHTMDELYEHRIVLYITLCKTLAKMVEKANENGSDFRQVWRSKYHSDGELCFGTGTQFVLGINYDKGKQISYHIPIEKWEETDFADILEKAPEWDGHTPADVLERLKNL